MNDSGWLIFEDEKYIFGIRMDTVKYFGVDKKRNAILINGAEYMFKDRQNAMNVIKDILDFGRCWFREGKIIMTENGSSFFGKVIKIPKYEEKGKTKKEIIEDLEYYYDYLCEMEKEMKENNGKNERESS